jgi:mannitol-1-phosphate 5-dehydrogenase
MTKIAIQFGAGNIGRGFIAAELSKAGYEVVFSDVVDPLIKEINKQRQYTIEILDVERNNIVVNNVRGINSTKDPEALTQALKEAEIVTTAVGAGVLKFVAPSIAKGIQARRKAGAGPLNVIACENLVGNSSTLKDLVLKNLNSEEDRNYLEENVGFPNCSVDRIVPPFKGENMLSVGVEEFDEWIVEEPAIKGPKPDIPGMQFTDNLTAYVQRKLFTLNCGHAIAAYLGYLKNIETIDKAVADDEVRNIVIKVGLPSMVVLDRH